MNVGEAPPQSQGQSVSGLFRVLDIGIAGLALGLLSPVLIGCALLVRYHLGKPVFFTQIRAGRDNQPFNIIKFRTMRNANDGDGRPLADADRLTRLGHWLRRTSLDELPELLNVLKGDMSLVGPRPLFLRYFPFYTARERLRLSVRPGLTGLAQISGRNYLGWERKLELDAWYVEHLSPGLYLKVLSLTAIRVWDWRKVATNPYTAERPLDEERAAQDPSMPSSSGPDTPAREG